MSIILKITSVIIAALSGYLLGSISFSIIISKLYAKKDVREYGSGNAGLTNMLRVFGPFPAALTLIGDFSKGIMAVLLGRVIIQQIGGFDDTIIGAYIGGISVILGHIFPLYFQFKGGKGILTTAGVILLIDWRVFLILIAVFAVIVAITKYVSLGSIIAASGMPVVTAIFTAIDSGSFPLIISNTAFALVIAITVTYMHRQNIKRLLSGTESKIGSKKKESVNNG